MPILNYGRPDNWELIPSLTKGEIFIFRQYIFDAKKKFKYKDDKLFLKTIEPNWDYTNPYIYLYDSSLEREEDQMYIYKLQELLKVANEMIYKVYKDDYKLDIMGTWDVGKIVVMRRRKLSSNKSFKELNRKALIKRYQNAGIIPKSSFIG